MNRAINASLLGLMAVVAFYCVAMHHNHWALKYYPKVNELHFSSEAVPKELQGGRVKFVMVALMGMVISLPVLLIGFLVPRSKTSAMVIHGLGWLTLTVGAAFMIHREWHRFLE